jgi:SAM-dependent methyltransferase
VNVRGTRWDPQQYLKFSDHRLRPALELLDRVPLEAPAVVYDLGCGSGHVTRTILERWPSARVCGIDSSKEMLAKAAAQPGKIEWIEADVADWSPMRFPISSIRTRRCTGSTITAHCSHACSNSWRREAVLQCRCR